jgi:hypothetical protein
MVHMRETIALLTAIQLDQHISVPKLYTCLTGVHGTVCTAKRTFTPTKFKLHNNLQFVSDVNDFSF